MDALGSNDHRMPLRSSHTDISHPRLPHRSNNTRKSTLSHLFFLLGRAERTPQKGVTSRAALGIKRKPLSLFCSRLAPTLLRATAKKRQDKL